MNMNLGWSLVVEKLLNYELPEKAKHLRVIIAELGRIASHLVAMGCYGLDLGTFSPFLYAFREREKILDLFEEACGARLTYSYITPGGVTADLPKGWLQECDKFLDELEPVIAEYHTLLTTNAIFIKRTARIGVLPAETAIDYGCTGPVLRGSGVDYDLRRDGENRYRTCTTVRLSSCRAKGRALSTGPRLPTGASRGDPRRLLASLLRENARGRAIGGLGAPGDAAICHGDGRLGRTDQDQPQAAQGEAYLETEAPKGQMGFGLVSDGSAIPWRVRARSSSFCNLSVTSEICRGCLIADVPAIIGSLDIVLGEIDR